MPHTTSKGIASVGMDLNSDKGKKARSLSQNNITLESMDGELISIREALAFLPVSAFGLYALVKDGTIPSLRIGTKIFLRKADIDSILQHGTTQPQVEGIQI